MNVIGVLIAFAIFTAVFSCYCATTNKNEALNAKLRWRKQVDRPHLHFIDQKQLYELNKQQRPILFRIEDYNADIRLHGTSEKHMGITFEEFEKCLPWIPYGNRILISNSGGFGPLLVKRLRKLQTRRELFLVSEDVGSAESSRRRQA